MLAGRKIPVPKGLNLHQLSDFDPATRQWSDPVGECPAFGPVACRQNFVRRCFAELSIANACVVMSIPAYCYPSPPPKKKNTPSFSSVRAILKLLLRVRGRVLYSLAFGSAYRLGLFLSYCVKARSLRCEVLPCSGINRPASLFRGRRFDRSEGARRHC